MKARIWNFKRWVPCMDDREIRGHYEKMLKESGFRILKVTEHLFYPYGYTCLFLIAESHLAIHTFPECGKMYVELSSCNKTKYRIFRRILMKNQ